MFKLFQMRPIIGVTGPAKGGWVAWWFIKVNILLSGGRPKRITPITQFDMGALDGLVIGGGADVGDDLFDGDGAIDAVREVFHHRSGLIRRFFFMGVHCLRLIGSYNVPQQHTKDEARDKLEMDLLHNVFERRLPVLGICRGAQLLNVFCGGSLHRSLKSFYQETSQIRTVLPLKEIVIDPQSQLARIIGTVRCRVNALHWQAIDNPGEHLRVVAREQTQVIQAIEHENHPFAMGVQWHPEFLLPHRRQRKLFSALVQAAQVTV
jgi:putative glutamine amidotransferase